MKIKEEKGLVIFEPENMQDAFELGKINPNIPSYNATINSTNPLRTMPYVTIEKCELLKYLSNDKREG
jgi:hypothetical protein